MHKSCCLKLEIYSLNSQYKYTHHNHIIIIYMLVATSPGAHVSSDVRHGLSCPEGVATRGTDEMTERWPRTHGWVAARTNQWASASLVGISLSCPCCEFLNRGGWRASELGSRELTAGQARTRGRHRFIVLVCTAPCARST